MPSPPCYPWECPSSAAVSRRALLRAAGASGLAWLTPLSGMLAAAPPNTPQRCKSLILLWLSGGPSQLETFDPHPGKAIAGGSLAVATAMPGVQLAAGLPRLAEQMSQVSLVRNLVTSDGDHARAAYLVKTGYRAEPTIRHPAIGAVICHQLPTGEEEIPRHVSLIPDDWYGRGGYLGAEYDAFRADQPGQLPDNLQPAVPLDRFERRLDDVRVVDQQFLQGRLPRLEEGRLLHRVSIDQARRMMGSEQLQAFSLQEEPRSVRHEFGDSDFGRACLVALRLIRVGVRCVEVTLRGWDSHLNNHAIHRQLAAQLDPAFSALLRHLAARDLLPQTVVVCGGEFGRTPRLNPAEGRDHWPHGFSMALAGGGIRGGQVVGETDPAGQAVSPERGTRMADLHATILTALGIPPQRELMTPVGRPLKLCEGRPIPQLLQA